jgi:uncharacterized protein (TIGR02246 family)
MEQDATDRLRHLERCELVRSALARYCRSLDGADIGGILTHFAPDAVFRGADGVVREGRDAIAAFFRGLFATMPPGGVGGRHYVTNVDIDATTDENVMATSLFFMVAPGEGTILGLGTYRDVFRVNDATATCVDKFITLDTTIPLPTAPAQ